MAPVSVEFDRARGLVPDASWNQVNGRYEAWKAAQLAGDERAPQPSAQPT